MLTIGCPWCGDRVEAEFTYGNAAHVVRPENVPNIGEAEWTQYLYMEDNPRGLSLERWCHTFGCGEWFNVARDTVTHSIVSVYAMGEPPPRDLEDG